MPIHIPSTSSNTPQHMMWSIQQQPQHYNNNDDDSRMDAYSIDDPAAEVSQQQQQQSNYDRRRVSQDEEIKAYEATLANEARRNAEQEIERQQRLEQQQKEQQEIERLRQIAIREEQKKRRIEKERMFQLAQLELAQLEEERWRRMQLLQQQQQKQQQQLQLQEEMQLQQQQQQLLLLQQQQQEQELIQMQFQQQLQQQQQQQQMQFYSAPRKTVGFADSALLYSSDRTYEEVYRMWYNKDELATFKNERKLVVKALKKANFDVATVERSGKHCLRGYEAYFSLEVNKAMKDARSLFTSLVLTEQERQRSLGIHDDDAIRFACSAVSQWACDNAMKLGENDEIEVYGVLYEQNNYHPYHHNNNIITNTMDCSNYEQDEMIMGGQEQEQHHQAFDSNGEDVLDENGDNLAERLESALQLVRALRSGNSSNATSS